MPQRAFNTALAVIGILLLAAMVVVGMDWSRAARTGPAWRRRMIGAAICLLAALGLAPAQANAQTDTDKTPTTATAPAKQADELTKSKDWDAVTKAYASVGPLAAPQAKSTGAQRKTATDAIAAANKGLDQLLEGKLLDATEVKLIKDDLASLQKRMQQDPPTDFKGTCYDVMLYSPELDSVQRLTARMELLDKLLKNKTVKPEIAAKAVAACEADLAVLDNEKYFNVLPTEQKEEAKKLMPKAKEALANLKKFQGDAATSAPAGGSADVTKTKEWQKITAAWEYMTPLAVSGQSTQAQRKEAEKHVGAIQEAAFALAKAGTLEEAEASLLVMEAAKLNQAVCKNPPTDITVECYKPARFDPVQESYGRVQVRVQFLQKLVKAGKVHPETLAKILPTLEADLKVLADEKGLDTLPGNDRKQAVESRQQAHDAVEALKKLTLAKPTSNPA